MGATAELMVPKWFNKDPKLSPDETVAQLRCALAFRARALSQASVRYRVRAARGCHDHQIARCARADIPALAAGYGPAELDKAILDALLRAQGLDIFSGLKQNVAGLDARLTPDIDNAIIGQFPERRARRRRAFWSGTRSACSIRSRIWRRSMPTADAAISRSSCRAIRRRPRPAGQDHPGAQRSAHRLPAHPRRQRAISVAQGAGGLDRRAAQ